MDLTSQEGLIASGSRRSGSNHQAGRHLEPSRWLSDDRLHNGWFVTSIDFAARNRDPEPKQGPSTVLKRVLWSHFRGNLTELNI